MPNQRVKTGLKAKKIKLPQMIFFLKTTNTFFMYPSAAFILQNFKKILRPDPELWGCNIFRPKMALKKTLKNFMAPFYGWGSTASRLEPLRGGSLLFTTKFPEIPGTHFIDLRKLKGWVDLGATQWIWTQDPWIRNPAS